MNTIELRSGRWLSGKNLHGEPVVWPLAKGQTASQILDHPPQDAAEIDGVGVRVTDGNGNEIEPWVIRRTVDGALEAAAALLERYHED